MSYGGVKLPVGRLREQIAAGNAVLVVGSGVSIGATGNAPVASWGGLIREGIAYAQEVAAGLPANWSQLATQDLETGESSDWLDGVLVAADKVSKALGGPSGSDFRAFIRAAFENLTITDSSVVSAIADLGVAIATTNYDSVLESATGLQTVTWQQPERVIQALQHVSPAVVHLHGHWQHPPSVVLGAESYAAVVGDNAVRAIEQGMAVIRSCIFVGAGGTVRDPNFAALRRWLRSVLPDEEPRHYHLCRDEEADDLRAEYRDDAITPIAYGLSHEDLASFLAALAPSPGSGMQLTQARAAVSSAKSSAIEAIAADVRARAVLAEHMVSIETRQLDEILIPPVLLPVPHEQFVRDSVEEETPHSRVDPHEAAGEDGVVLIACSDGYGLSSALQWLAVEAVRKRPDRVPVVVDFKTFAAGHDPLEKAVRQELVMSGAIETVRSDLPPLVLAVDNVSARRVKQFKRMLAQLGSWELPAVLLGCRETEEGEVLAALREGGFEPKVRYIGPLNRHDIKCLVDLVEPARGTEIAAAVGEAASHEHIGRSPFAVGLLASILLHGESLLATASRTALLDAYVGVLLGRGEIFDDSRLDLDSHDRSHILSSLAERFVRANTGSLAQADVIRFLEDYFEGVGWVDNPMAVLDGLLRRRLLMVRGGKVRFAHHTFLHLFAAKRAQASRPFLEELYKRPIFYGPILKHLTALTRDDPEILRTVATLVLDEEVGSPMSDGPFTGYAPERAEAIAPGSLEELVGQIKLFDQAAAGTSSDEKEQDEGLDDWLDRMEDGDFHLEPFPADDFRGSPPAAKVLAVLSLVSNVLRDSELVSDLALKQRVLHRTLAVYGRLAELISLDEEAVAMIRELGEFLANGMPVDDAKREHFIKDFVRDMPIFICFGSMSMGLSSRKLIRTLDSCFAEEDFLADPRPVVMGALLGFDVQEDGWTTYFDAVRERHRDIAINRIFLRALKMSAYRHQYLTTADEARLLDILSDEMASEVNGSSNPRVMKMNKNQVAQTLQRSRMLAGQQRLPRGKTILDVVPADEGILHEEADG